MTKLTQKQKDKWPSSYFAVPELRKLPINDEIHTDMAWRMVDKTGGLSDEQRSKAKSRILRRAHKLGMNTDNWHARAEPKMEASDFENMRSSALENSDEDETQDFNESNPADSKDFEGEYTTDDADEKKIGDDDNQFTLSFSAMAIEMPKPDDENEHPNKVPFTGILTRIDQPSDMPLGKGSHGKRVILPKSVAEKSLSSLMCMAVDFTDDLCGHDPQQKIGIITGATIEGNAINIEGFFYGADFPIVVKRIQANKSLMGFSYEAQVICQPMGDDFLEIVHCAFTGAAVLYKDKAAYTSTSLSANAEEENKMSDEILKAINALNTRLDSIDNKVKEVQASSGQSMLDKVEPHMKACHAAADAMMAAGYGTHPEHGHAAMIKKVANHMMAQAAMGQVPHVFTDHNFLAASADKKVEVAASAEPNAEMKVILDKFAALETKLADSEAARFEASAAGVARKTITPEIKSLMANANISEADKGQVAIETVDAAFKERGLSVKKRIGEKLLMNANRMIKPTGVAE